MALVICRGCKTQKWSGDICPTCTAGNPVQKMKVHKAQKATGLMAAHFYHAGAAVSRTVATGNTN